MDNYQQLLTDITNLEKSIESAGCRTYHNVAVKNRYRDYERAAYNAVRDPNPQYEKLVHNSPAPGGGSDEAVKTKPVTIDRHDVQKFFDEIDAALAEEVTDGENR